MATKKKRAASVIPSRKKFILAESDYPNIQSMLDRDQKFARIFSMAKANGLPEDLEPGYTRVYENNGDMGIATMMLPDTSTWKEYLDDCEKAVAEMIINGENPRVKELGLDTIKTPKKGVKKVAKKKEVPAPSTDGVVTPKEGDAFRATVRKLCDSMGWTLTDASSMLTVEDEDGEDIASCMYKRGGKNGAWKKVADELEVLT